MKLSNKGRYAVRAVFDIAFFHAGRPAQVKDISERQRIPPRFLEQIFQELKRAGLVSSKRGPQGGYSLTLAADQVRVGDVIRAVEGPIVLCASDEPSSSAQPIDPTEAALSELAGQLQACFDSVTIASICQRATQMGLGPGGLQGYVYVI